MASPLSPPKSKIKTKLKSMASSKEKRKCIEQFCSITGADKEAARKLLDVCNYNVEVAINMHVEADESGDAAANTDRDVVTASPVASDDSNVRPPIPPVRGVLVESFGAAGPPGIRTRRRITRSIFDGFRDFQAEARQQEQELYHDGGSSSSSSSSASQKRKTLEDLFRPPLDVMHRGTFESAREIGLTTNKWLMVNIQNVQEFPCQVLNRDVWSNIAVKNIIREHFVFWQVYHDSEEGLRYMQFYKVLDWPYVAIVDPRTGENMITWNKIDAASFCDLVTEFLTEHPSLDGSWMATPPPKRSKSESILDASEDSQLEAAIRASLMESSSCQPDSSTTSCLSSSSSSKVNHEASTSSKCHTYSSRNSDDEEDYDVEIETFDTDSDDSPVEVTGRSNNKSTGTVGVAPAETNSNENGESSHGSADWKAFLGVEEDPKSNLALRFPDGSKDQLSVPSSSKLMALLLYVQSRGFAKEKYELVTNFPRRQLSHLDPAVSLKEAGLFPQETVFVQAR